MDLREAVICMNTFYRQASSIVGREDKELYTEALKFLNEVSVSIGPSLIGEIMDKRNICKVYRRKEIEATINEEKERKDDN